MVIRLRQQTDIRRREGYQGWTKPKTDIGKARIPGSGEVLIALFLLMRRKEKLSFAYGKLLESTQPVHSRQRLFN